MDIVNLGPFALPSPVLLLTAAAVAGRAVARRSGGAEAMDAEGALWKVLLAGLVAARAAFVAWYFDAYANAPWTMLDVRDGGFYPWAGVAGAVVMAACLAARVRSGRKALMLGSLAGAIAWGAGSVALHALADDQTRLPQVALTRLDGTPVDLMSFQGKPMVVNLWASWCPPCRREMPVLRDAQARHRDVVFVFVNQGESADRIERYLASEQLSLDHVLLDPALRLAALTGSAGLPTTLFFDRRGALVERRTGELSAATLAQRLETLRSAAAAVGDDVGNGAP